MDFMPIKYNILLCMLLLCGIMPMTAQNIVKISGRVIDADNQPVELAIVRIAGTTTGTSTNLEGKYELKVASADTVKVIYSCLGYREEERILRNPSGEVRLEVQLQKKTFSLQDVVVACRGMDREQADAAAQASLGSQD